MRDIYSTSQIKKTSAADVLARFPKTKVPEPTVIEIESKIAKLEKELAIRLAIDTFLDCDHDKVKVSKRIAKVPKSARGKMRGKSVRTVSSSVKGMKPMLKTSTIFS